VAGVGDGKLLQQRPVARLIHRCRHHQQGWQQRQCQQQLLLHLRRCWSAEEQLIGGALEGSSRISARLVDSDVAAAPSMRTWPTPALAFITGELVLLSCPAFSSHASDRVLTRPARAGGKDDCGWCAASCRPLGCVGGCDRGRASGEMQNWEVHGLLAGAHVTCSCTFLKVTKKLRVLLCFCCTHPIPTTSPRQAGTHLSRLALNRQQTRSPHPAVLLFSLSLHVGCSRQCCRCCDHWHRVLVRLANPSPPGPARNAVAAAQRSRRVSCSSRRAPWWCLRARHSSPTRR
jgi:hypothetical protein